MSANHSYWVYMVSNKTRSTLYIGITDNLERRISQHRAGEIAGFTQHYHCTHSFILDISATSVAQSRAKNS